MSRKAIFRDKPEQIEETMPKKELEYYFTAIQERFNQQDVWIKKRFEEVDKRFEEQEQMIQRRFDIQDKKLETILDVVKFYEVERKDLKSVILDHDIRLRKLERHSV